MKEKNVKITSNKLLECKQLSRNHIKNILTWDVFLVIGREGELRQIDQGTRKLMAVHKAWPGVDRLYVSRKEGGIGLANIKDSSWCIDTMTWRLHKKASSKTDYDHSKQYRQHKHQQNKKNQKAKMGRKTTAWTFQATNKRNLKRENLDMTKKGKSLERNRNFLKSNTK